MFGQLLLENLTPKPLQKFTNRVTLISQGLSRFIETQRWPSNDVHHSRRFIQFVI